MESYRCDTNSIKILLITIFSNKGNGDIAYCDVQGELGMVVVNGVNNAKCSSAGVQEDSVDFNFHKDVDESEDEDNENVISLEKLKRETLGPEESESEIRSSK